MSMYDWGAPLNLNTGNNWGMLPQFQSIAGYGMPSMEVPDLSNGITSMGGPAGAIGSGGVVSPGSASPSMFSQFSDWFDSTGFLARKGADGNVTGGWGQAGLGLLQGGLGAFMGSSQLALASEALAQSKKQFNLNYAAQKQTTNAALEDRQNARIASREGASNPYDSTADYMSKYGIK